MPQKIDEVADVVDPGLLGLALAQRMRSVAGSPIMELLKTTAKGDYISFASGLPDPALFPTARLAEIAEEVLTQDGRAALQYGPAEGYAPLRAWVADSLRQRGLVDATPEHVLITHGSQQALDLAARAFLDPEAPVLLESPSYLAAIQIFNSFQARYRTVEMDAEGIDADRAAATIREDRPRLVFTLPNYQNPTGITMSLTRRQRLADAAAQHGIPLLEDDAYFDLRYDGEPLPPIGSARGLYLCGSAPHRAAGTTQTDHRPAHGHAGAAHGVPVLRAGPPRAPDRNPAGDLLRAP
jgi:2-aminoadipate transaminase